MSILKKRYGEEKTVYCGSGKTQNERWIKATINIDKIKDHIEEYKGHKFFRIYFFFVFTILLNTKKK